jgi:CheY-like chemotaxis protein/two-component sensor histidine kinase
VERNARTLLKHVNDLLDVARLEAGKMAASYADVDLARLVRETAANFDGVAGQRAIQYDVRTPETIRADVDPDKVQRIVINLLGNAFKFTPDGGRVSCELFVDEDDGQPWVGLRVSDSGPGVPSPLREAVFERFVQAEDHATRRFGGTGLGLAIVRDFVDLHHGHVTIGDTPGGGATFVVRLPRLAPSGTRVRAADARDVSLHANLIRATLDELSTLDRSPQPVVRPLGAPSPTSVTVLVVEDNPDMNRFVSDALRDRYRVLSAHGAEEALAMAASEKPDLIISDVMMAGMSGEALLQSLRARPEFDSVPVVMLTAKADEESRVRLLNAGAQDYLTKPVLMEELRARVANLVAIKKSRDILQEGPASAGHDLAALAVPTSTASASSSARGSKPSGQIARRTSS